MVFKERIAIFSANHTKPIITLCGQNAELLVVKAGGIYNHHWALNLNSVNQLIFVMVKCGVLFEVRTEFLNNI
jgi:hypothetical protein